MNQEDRNPLFAFLQEGDVHSWVLVLYALAHDAGITWNGGKLARWYVLRDRYGYDTPPRTNISYLARRLGLDRHVVSMVIQALLERGWVRDNNGRYEPEYAVLRERAARAKPADKLKIPWKALADPRFNLTDAMVVGKIAKAEGVSSRRFRPTRASLAWDLMRHVRTIARSAAKLLALGVLVISVQPRWPPYLSLSSSTQLSPEGKEVVPTSEARMLLRTLAKRMEADYERPPPDQKKVQAFNERKRRFAVANNLPAVYWRPKGVKEPIADPPPPRVRAPAGRGAIPWEFSARNPVNDGIGLEELMARYEAWRKSQEAG